MSDNEIKPVAWVERNENGHDRMWSYSLESWANRPANPEPLYDQSAIDALTKQISELKTMLSIAEFQRKEMQAERDAAVAYAARYRWLRTRFRVSSLDMSGQHGYAPTGEVGRIKGPSFDAAIDAARAKEGQG